MTKVLARFRLQSPWSEPLLARLSETWGVYGLLCIEVDQAGGRLAVEYDATRLTVEEVAAVLRGAGIAAIPEPVT